MCRYTYMYAGTGHMATWISSKQFVVIDLAAGPCDYGPEVSPSGTVTPTALPNIPNLFSSSRLSTRRDTTSNDIQQAGTKTETQERACRCLLFSKWNNCVFGTLWIKWMYVYVEWINKNRGELTDTLAKTETLMPLVLRFSERNSVYSRP